MAAGAGYEVDSCAVLTVYTMMFSLASSLFFIFRRGIGEIRYDNEQECIRTGGLRKSV